MLHGVYLAANHAWRALRPQLAAEPGRFERGLGQALTLLAVVVGWVFFRAADLGAALSLLEGMAGMNGVTEFAAAGGPVAGLALSAALLLVVRLAPNTQELTGYTGPAGSPVDAAPRPARALWQPNLGWAMASGAAFGAALLSLSQASEFLYYQF